jgi:hypothetical protein
MNIPEAVVKKRREAKERGERKLRMLNILAGIKRGVADDSYMNTPEFCKNALEYQRKMGHYHPTAKETMAELKCYYESNGQKISKQ